MSDGIFPKIQVYKSSIVNFNFQYGMIARVSYLLCNQELDIVLKV